VIVGVPEDIKSAYIEVGSSYNVLNKVSGEYCMYELNSQVTKPFIREFFLEAYLPSDTQARAGDVIEFETTRTRYLVMNSTPDMLENQVIENACVLYKVNCTGEIRRPVETRNAQYKVGTEWQTIAASTNALITEVLFGYMMSDEDDLGMLGIKKDDFYIPSSYGIRVLDRIEPFSGEFRMVTAIRKHTYPNVDFCTVEVDTRE
jgi:hypothetical protein